MMLRALASRLPPSLAQAALKAGQGLARGAIAACEPATAGAAPAAFFTASVLPKAASPARTALKACTLNFRPFSAAADAASAPAQPEYDPNAFIAPHPSSSAVPENLLNSRDPQSYLLMHPVYSEEYVKSITPTHKPPVKLHEKVGYYAVQSLRSSFDLITGYGRNMTEKKWLTRMLYLETVAGVPGMVGAMLRHLRSLRSMKRDRGWIHTLLEEAENERMHLLTFMQLKEPGPFFRLAVLLGQGVFFNAYMFAYIVSPRTCHAMVGYLEEEAVKTYTKVIEELREGKLPEWQRRTAPEIAIKYWKLKPNAGMEDLFLAVRADEAAHKHVNHTFSEMNPDDTNVFAVGSVHTP